jgi:hypothetical protein
MRTSSAYLYVLRKPAGLALRDRGDTAKECAGRRGVSCLILIKIDRDGMLKHYMVGNQ